MSVVLKVENVSKQYRLGTVGSGTLRDDMTRFWAKLTGKEDPTLKVGEVNDRTKKGNSDYVWALNDINFEVKQGEVLGVIGKNGAGKSTLLKILSKVTAPTTGRIRAKGRIASLLEVGTGFHPELTGRENIYLNGAILGMTKAEIKAKLDEIVDFSGVEKYLDTPVKRYSSGMTVRLGFAVAAHLEPEILIVDEVLAVGDAEFQKKAIGKMQDVSKGEGRTVLFVSHNMAAVKELCNTGLLIENGRAHSVKPIEDTVEAYMNVHNNTEMNSSYSWSLQDAPGGAEMQLLGAELYDVKNKIKGIYNSTEEVSISIKLKVNKYTEGSRIVLQLISAEEVVIFATSNHKQLKTGIGTGVYCFQCVIPKNLLNQGNYRVRIQAGIPGNKVLIPPIEIIGFQVKNDSAFGAYFGEKWPGVIAPDLEWKQESVVI